MKKYLIYVSLVLYIKWQICAADDSNKVILTDYFYDVFEKDYFNEDTFKAEVHKVNKTYSRLYLHYDIKDDILSNAEFGVGVIRSETGYDPWDLEAEYIIKLCDKNDKNRQYLPNFWLNISDPENNKTCIKKGSYTSEDAGMFKYSELLPGNKIKGYYFAVTMALRIMNPYFYTLISPIELSQSIYAE